VHRARRHLRRALRDYDSDVPSDIAVRALKSPEGLVVWIWTPRSSLFLHTISWKDTASQFLRHPILPRKMQGDPEGNILDVSPIVNASLRAGILASVEGYPRFHIKGTRPIKPDPLSVRVCNELAKDFDIVEEVADWEWARDKQGAQTTAKLHKFSDNVTEPCDIEALEFLLMLTELLWSQPHFNGEIIKEPVIPWEDADKIHLKDASVGIDLPGNPRGTNKRENGLFAMSQFRDQCLSGPHETPYVYDTQTKGNETLKKTKDQRKIFCESGSQLFVFMMCFSGVIYRKRNLFNGAAQSLSQGGSTGLQYIMKLTPDLEWDKIRNNPSYNVLDKAREILSAEDSLSESDKTAWEYRIHPTLKAIMITSVMYMTNFEGNENYYFPLINAIASFLCPLVALSGDLVIVAPSSMPSGSLFTLYGNTDIHHLLTISFKHKKQFEAIEKKDPLLEKNVQTWYQSILLQGDDFISRNIFGDEYDKYVDSRFGTITKAAFGDVSTCKFLQRSIRWRGKLPQLVYDSNRAKIKMCMPRESAADQADALKSIILSTGDPTLIPHAFKAFKKLDVSPLHISDSPDIAGYTGSALFDAGVLERYWIPGKDIVKQTGTLRALGVKYGIHPDYLQTVLARQ